MFISELHSNIPISAPGYCTFQHRECPGGGLAALVSHALAPQLTKVDLSCMNQCWIELDDLPNVAIVGCYLPPPDSPYFSIEYLATLQSRVISSEKHIIIVGDLNARCGERIRELTIEKPLLSYPHLPDPVRPPKSNGKALLEFCKNTNTTIINNLKTTNSHFRGSLTFKKRNRWISELDLAITSTSLIDCIVDLVLNTSDRMPSDHAALSLSVHLPKDQKIHLKQLITRASYLGEHSVCELQAQFRTRRAIPYSSISSSDVLTALNDQPPPDTNDITEAVESLAQRLYALARDNKRPREVFDQQQLRWKRIMDSTDKRLLWKAVTWNGDVNWKDVSANDKPSDDQFKIHFESLLNPNRIDFAVHVFDFTSNIYIPVLDDDISPVEIDFVIKKQLKPNSGCGPDGVAPGLFKLLNPEWIIWLSTVLNAIFQSAYPQSFAQAKMLSIFKKGNANDCNNYRGISIMNSIAKIYDYVLANRLSKWFVPDREQAGAQPGRSCLDHIMTLRLIILYAMSINQDLYIVFVDFSKAYDRIPRDKLMQILKDQGCGSKMLSALSNMYKVTYGLMGSALMRFVQGVRQGAPTSGFLFTLYANDLIRRMKNECPDDGFLKSLHLLLLMDDTCILATGKEQCLQKLRVLTDFCNERDIVINELKTQFMIIGKNAYHDDTLHLNEPNCSLRISYTKSYVYLGAVFTDDGRISTSISSHCNLKSKQVVKLINFLSKNKQAPFPVKKKVFDAAFMSSILYSGESWLNSPIQVINTMFMSAIKCLLGVRSTTANDLCLIESGYPPVKYILKEQQRKYFLRIRNRQDQEDDPLCFALSLHRRSNTRTAIYIDELFNNESFCESGYENLKLSIRNSPRSKFITYLSLNPDLTPHPVYESSSKEYQRIIFSRLRLSSHNLKIETGRWSRIDRENRLCQCGAVQTEEHVLCNCPLTQHLRRRYQNIIFSFPELFSAPLDHLLPFVYQCVSFFE